MHYVVWYNKKIHISKENKKAILHFEGSDYKTKIWINGKYIGTNEGGYHRFSFEIDKYIQEGENDITVKVEDSLAKEQPRGKQRYKKESWKCWYIQTTGIWKTVWIEYVPKYSIKNVKSTPNLDNRNIQLEYETNISEKELEENNFYIETEISFEYENYILTILIKDFKDDYYLSDEYVYSQGRKISNLIFNEYLKLGAKNERSETIGK